MHPSADLLRDIPDFPEPGIVFKDITPVLDDSSAFGRVVVDIAAPYQELNVTHVVGIESRGFIIGAPVALELGAGFVPVRKPGKLPYETVSLTYDLEYGTDTIEMHVDAVGPGDVVLIVDDVIATGGTAAATLHLVQDCGATVVGIAAFVELGFLNGREKLDGVPIHTLVTV